MTDLVIVSMHEKGFPQADFYKDLGGMSAMEFEALGAVPDTFFTMKKGQSLAAAKIKARMQWPDAEIVEAVEDEPDDED